MAFNYRLSPTFIQQRTGGYWQQTFYVDGGELKSSWSVAGGSKPTSSSTRMWESYVTTSDTIKRVKPLGFQSLTNAYMTNRTFEEQVNSAGINSDNAGNFGPNTAPGVISPDGNVAQRVDADALLSMLENIKAETFNVPVFLGEGKETVNFTIDVIKGLAKTYSAVKHGRLRDLYRTVLPSQKGSYAAGSRIVDKSANMWLQWRYAVQPMVYDFQAMLDYAIHNPLRPVVRHMTGRSAQSFQKMIKGSDYYVSHVTGRYAVEYGMYYEISQKAEFAKRLGLCNFAQALYELTPASFILDWVIPVGRTVGAADALVGVSPLGWYRTTKVRSVSMKQRLWKPVEGTYHPYSAYSSPATTTYKLYSRVVAPTITVPIPSISESLSMPRVLDAVSIAHGLVRGFRS